MKLVLPCREHLGAELIAEVRALKPPRRPVIVWERVVGVLEPKRLEDIFPGTKTVTLKLPANAMRRGRIAIGIAGNAALLSLIEAPKRAKLTGCDRPVDAALWIFNRGICGNAIALPAQTKQCLLLHLFRQKKQRCGGVTIK